MLDEQINVLLNHVDPRTVYIRTDILHRDNIVFQHGGKNGLPSKTEYVITKQQAIALAKSILQHYKQEEQTIED